MPMEVAAVDRLVEKAKFHSDVALAVAEAMDITLEARNFVTVPVLDARLSALETKMESRFASVDSRFANVDSHFAELEKSIASTKVEAAKLYAGLVIALFTALAGSHYWLVSREDQLIAKVEARSDQRFQQVDTHFQQVEAHFQQTDAKLEELRRQMDAKLDGMRQQMDAKFDGMRQQMDDRLAEIRNLIANPRRGKPH